MKEKNSRIYKHIGHVKVDINDIQDIIKTVQEFKNNPASDYQISDSFSIEVNNNILDSEEELEIFQGKKITDITIGYSSIIDHLSVNISNKGAYIFSSKNDIYSQGLVSKLEKLLSQKKRKFQWTGNLVYYFPLSFFCSLFLLVSDKGTLLYYFGLFITTILLVFVILYFIGNTFRKTVISITKNEVSYWQKNKDEIINRLISALFGGLVTFLLYKFGIFK